MSELTVAAIKKLKVAELKAELTKRGLAVKGKKDELAKRLIEAIQEDTAEDNEEEAAADTQETNDSQESLNDSQESQELENTTAVSENSAELGEDSGIQSAPSSTEGDIKENSQEKQDDWVMVEPPKAEETAAVEEAAEDQQQAIVDEATEALQQDEPMEEDAPAVDETAKQETAETESETAENKKVEEEPQSSKEETKKEEVPKEEEEEEAMEQQSVETEKKDEKRDTKKDEKKERKTPSKDVKGKAEKEKKESPKKEEPPPEDKYVDVESEEGEDQDQVLVEEGHVGLDSYTCDLNFVIGEKGLSGHTLSKNGMAYMWGGARANKGTKGGKVGFEVKILESRPVNLPEDEAPIHAIRIGWSTDKSSMQLGESSHSYGYESTGKLCASSSFVEYGEAFETGDVIGTFLDLESEPKTLKYTKNGKDLGVAMSLTVNLEEKPLYPHVLVRNMSFEANFGGKDEPWFEPLEGYSLLQNAGEEKITDNGITPPEDQEHCEVVLVVGLPNAGKTSWVKKHTDSHADKKYNVIGIGQILERCRLEGKRRKKGDGNYVSLMKNAITILGKLYQICPKRTRNFIYDQTNVYETAQNTKMEPFEKFKRKAVIVVPTHDNLRRRTSDAKRKTDTVIDIPFADLCDMKCEFHVPEVGKLFHEVTYPELDEKNARKTVRDYQSDGARAKRTGRDEFYPKKKRDDHHGRRDRYSGGGRRDDGWKNSGSGYGGGYSSGGYGGYNKGGRNNYSSGGYNKGRDQYQDPYRRGSGGSGGYRQNSYSSGSGSYNKGGSYNSGSSNYGYNYGSNYGSSNYSSGYGSYGGSGNYNYGQNYSQQGSNRGANTGGWGQYNTGNYNNQQSGWGSNTGSWGNYNYNYGNYGSNNYGSGSGYSY